MKIKCIALDLDGTTLNSQGELSERNRSAIEQAIEAGIQVAAASGRPLHSLPKALLEIPGIRYAVTSNGAAVYDLKEKTCLRQFKLETDAVDDILTITEAEFCASGCAHRTEDCAVYETFIDGRPYAERAYVEDPVRFGASEQAVSYIQSTRKPIDGMKDFIKSHRDVLDCIDIVVKSEEQKQRLWKTLEKSIRNVYITSSVRQLLEISDVNAGKDSAVKFLIESLGIRREELAAFGDGHNDSGLLRFAGLGFAVENASAECMAAADRITASNDKDGVAEGIHYILVENEKNKEG